MQQETHPFAATDDASRTLVQPFSQHETTTGNHLPGLRGTHGDHRDKDRQTTGLSDNIGPASKSEDSTHVRGNGHRCCRPSAFAATGQLRLKNVSKHLKKNDEPPKSPAKNIQPHLLAPKRLKYLGPQPQA